MDAPSMRPWSSGITSSIATASQKIGVIAIPGLDPGIDPAIQPPPYPPSLAGESREGRWTPGSKPGQARG
jgi:hypothetical protein